MKQSVLMGMSTKDLAYSFNEEPMNKMKPCVLEQNLREPYRTFVHSIESLDSEQNPWVLYWNPKEPFIWEYTFEAAVVDFEYWTIIKASWR